MDREDEERGKTVCAGCGKPKDVGLVVCWPCWRMKGGFKYSDLPLDEWLADLHGVPNPIGRKKCTVICGLPTNQPGHFVGHNYTFVADHEPDARQQVLAVHPRMDIQAVLFHDDKLKSFDRAFIELINEPLPKGKVPLA